MTSRAASPTIRPGTRVVAEGPFGVFTDAARRRDEGGADRAVASASRRSARCSRRWTATSSVVYRVISDDDVIFREELDELAATQGAALHYVVGDHVAPERRRLLSPSHLRALVPDIAEREVYVCGPPAMADATRRSARTAGSLPATSTPSASRSEPNRSRSCNEHSRQPSERR